LDGFWLPVESEEEIHAVGEQLIRDWPVCRLMDNTADAKQRAQAGNASFCVVVNDDNVVLGTAHANDLETARSVEEIIDFAPVTLRPSYTVEEASKLLSKNKQDAVSVTSSDGKLLGVFRVRGTERRKN
jgi:Mg/Co/Ni transporter MgtE